ncbi:MAG: hypothetical protein E6R14_08645 [Thermomicrobiales bacterium]|nr:MAG: hypothetical protein E6R14_08645 [Thermomicrobiales bacterium]
MPLESIELENLFNALGTPPKGRQLVLEARQKAPVRSVHAGPSNVPVDFVSAKMGRVMKCESRQVEYARAIHLEHDTDTLEYYMQPVKLDVVWADAVSNRKNRFQHTPDILRIRKSGITLEEWKTESKLERLSEKNPERYERRADGSWHSRLLEEHLSSYGIGYELHSDAEHPRRFIENLQVLADFWHPDCEPLDAAKAKTLRTLFAESSAIHLHELICGEHNLSVDDVFRALVEGVVAADLYGERLADARRVRIFRDATALEFYERAAQVERNKADERRDQSIVVGSRVLYDGVEYEVLLEGNTDYVLRNDVGQVTRVQVEVLQELARSKQVRVQRSESAAPEAEESPYLSSLDQLSDVELRQALARKQALELATQREGTASVPARTLRRWRSRMATAEATGGNALAALAPLTRNRGNRASKLPDRVLAICRDAIASEHLTATNKSITTCYLHVVERCNKEGLVAPSKNSLKAIIEAIPIEEATKAREGSKAAYKYKEICQLLEYQTSVHGVRPFEVVHIDHTEVDVETRSSINGTNLGRPWLTMAVAAGTRRVVGSYLTYDAPSYRSVMMVLRDMVRRHGRLPEQLVVDGGKEFEGQNFSALTQAYGVHVIRRKGKPQHGSVMERQFGVSNTQFFHNLAGNTQVTKNVRQVVKSVNPKNLTEWTLEYLHCAFDNWSTEFFDTKPHPALGISPREAEERGFAQTGQRLHRMVAYDRDFLILTCPTVKPGTRQVVPGRGIKVDNVWFNAPVLRDAKLSGTKVPVRQDPWSPRHVYVYVGGRWEQCLSKYYALLGDYTETELQAAFAELKRVHNLTELHNLPAERLVEWLKNLTPSGGMELFAQRQTEARNLHTKLGIATSVARFEGQDGEAAAEQPVAQPAAEPAPSPDTENTPPMPATSAPASPVPPAEPKPKPAEPEPEQFEEEIYDLF